jgi:alpha-tubulin suppressor-like RCC1 family protein
VSATSNGIQVIKKSQMKMMKTLLPKASQVKITPSKVYMWGSGKDGRCGNGKESNEKVPLSVQSQHKFIQISSGYHHTAGVTKDGMLLTWGRGIFGQLGHGDTENYTIPTPIENLIKIQIS